MGRSHRVTAGTVLRIFLGAGAAAAIAALAAFCVPLPARLAALPSVVVEFRDGTPAHVFLSPDEKWRIRLPLSEVDPSYVKALLRLEDKRFFRHFGVDPVAVARALYLNLSRGRVVSGGSTITMQLTRVLEPRPRTLWSKLIEALRAVQLELRMSKQEILEAYMTFIPFGKNVEGVEAASLAYFGHSARSLSAEEVAVLLAVPQDPGRRFPRHGNRERLATARDEVARNLAQFAALPVAKGSTVNDTLRQVTSAALPDRLRPFPRRAPHAAFFARGRRSTESRIRTTLDAGMQLTAERLVAAARPENDAEGIHNTAAVVVDHSSAEVLALVGNFDFWDNEHGGQIIGFDTPRSPGSALKPFLYAMALDRGLALPESLVPDVPLLFGSYAPRNFEGGYSGLVRLEEALSRSLNVPFVGLLDRIGVESFLAALRSMGVESLRAEPGYYGLSAIIGSAEVTPLEMAGLYAALAEGGRYRPLRIFMGEKEAAESSRVFSEGAAFLTRRALSLRNRPDLPDSRRLTGMQVPIHWKTGTSFGLRDAWAVGSGPGFTAAIWLGNFDQRPSSSLVGARAAGPILFDLLEAIEPRTGAQPETPPSDLKAIEVCAYSGYPAGPDCPRRSAALALRRSVPTSTCPYHIRADVDLATGLRLAPACRAGKHYRAETFLNWPLSIKRWLKDRDGEMKSLPPLAPGCAAGGKRVAPRIVSPPAGRKLMLIAGLARDSQEVPLEAECETPGATLSWFMDGKFLASLPAHERLWWSPLPGSHEITVMDEAGLSARRMFSVLQNE